MTQAKADVIRLLEQVFDELQKKDDPNEHIRRRQEFVFHMTDWIEDLNGLTALYENPQKYESEASKTIVGFLYHVIPHLNTAGCILLDRIPEAFEDVK